MMTLMVFCLPPQAGEKIILQCCTALVISIFMLYFTQKIPAMGSQTPLIGKAIPFFDEVGQVDKFVFSQVLQQLLVHCLLHPVRISDRAVDIPDASQPSATLDRQAVA